MTKTGLFCVGQRPSTSACVTTHSITITPHAVAVNRNAIWFPLYMHQHTGFNVATLVVKIQGNHRKINSDFLCTEPQIVNL